MDKRYQVFISSTIKDLQEERKQVIEAVLNCKCIPASMEMFPAIDIKHFEYIKKIIDNSDYYIIILGARYGSLDEDGVGYTEKEYDYAVSKKIPIIAFIHSDIESIPLRKADTEPSLQKKLEGFRAKVMKGRLVNYWKDASDLRTKVTKSLYAAFDEIPRIGWVRGNEIACDQEDIIKELKKLREFKDKYQKKLSIAQEEIKTLKAYIERLKSPSKNRKKYQFTIKGVTFIMIHVEGGTFRMGASSEQVGYAELSEQPEHDVTLSDYWIGETPVTQALWEAVLEENGSKFKDNPNNPVNNISWDDCWRFIEKLKTFINKDFRLPTEAEWEFAARGGNKMKHRIFSGSNNLKKVAWYTDNAEDSIHPVKALSANELGIFDMCGNVWEWCYDWFGRYSSEPQVDPFGPGKGTKHVARGGAYDSYEEHCRVSNRYYFINKPRPYLGFRLVFKE